MLITWLFFLAETVVCDFCHKMQTYTDNIEAIQIMIILITSLVFILAITKNVKKKSEFLVLVGGYLLRVGLMFWDYYCRNIFKLPNVGYDADFYHYKGTIAMNDYSAMKSDKYAQVLGFLYNRFGIARLIGQYFNILLSITAIILMLKMIEMLNVNNKARFIALQLASFLPNFAIINSALLRETPIIFLLTLSLYFFIKWWKNGKIGYVAIAIVISIIAAYFHSGAIAPILGYAIIVSLYDRKNASFKINTKTIVAVSVFLIGFSILFSLTSDTVFSKYTRYDSAEEITEHVGEGDGDSGYEVGFSTGNATADMVINTPFRIFYFIFSPVPWNWRGLQDIIAFVFSAMFFGMCYILSAFIILDKNIKNKAPVIAFLILAISTALLFAWGVQNAGTALRHREKFTIQYLVLFTLCADRLGFEKLSDAFSFIDKKNKERRDNKSKK